MPLRYEDVFGQLIDALAKGQFAEGEWLPSEGDLAARLGSGRGVVREALRALELRGLVDVHDRGQQVLAGDRWDVHEADVLIALADHDRMPQLLREAVAARATAEREAARLATGNATEREQRGDECDDAFVKAEAWFHTTLGLLSGNRVLAKMSEPLHLALAAIRHRRAPEHEGDALAHHRRILEGVSSGEPDLAVRAVDGYAQQLAHWLAG